MNNWEGIVTEKIAEAKARGAKKRGWIPLRKAFLSSSINYRMELSEQVVFLKLVLMADDYGPVPGLISDNDFRPMPHEYLAHQAHCPLEVLEATIKKSIEDDSIYENSHGIFFTHFDDYQFTAYDRQKPYRQAKKMRDEDPDKYIQGKYGNAVARTQEDLEVRKEIRAAEKAKGLSNET